MRQYNPSFKAAYAAYTYLCDLVQTEEESDLVDLRLPDLSLAAPWMAGDDRLSEGMLDWLFLSRYDPDEDTFAVEVNLGYV